MKNRDIIVTGLQSWDIGIGSNCINIAKELAKSNRVLYVNRALDRISKLKAKNDRKAATRIKSIKGEIEDLRQVESNLWVLDPRVMLESINWMPVGLFNIFNRYNNKKLATAIADARDRLNFKDVVLFIDNDFFRGQNLKEFLKADYFIYYIRDYLVKQQYFKKHGARMEQEIIRKADLVVANSLYLANYAKNYNTKSFDIGQGCDFTFFNPQRVYNKPIEFASISSPVIGYVGALVNYRLDINLLELLAARHPEWNWVFVGPEDQAFQESKLHEFSNVYFLGKKNESELAAYVSYFDVCINPQLDNDATRGNYPRKVDEYLALGKPVVATFTDFMHSFSEYVYLSKGVEGYEIAIQAALAENGDSTKIEARQKFALSHTWENSVKKMFSYFENDL